MNTMQRLLAVLAALLLCLAAPASALPLADGEALTGGVYEADGDDESVLEVSGTTEAALTGVTLRKTGGSASSADAASFRGVNAAVRACDQAKVTLEGCVIEASAPNATGVFAYDGATITIRESTVAVTGGGAGGVQVAGGGALIGENLTVTSASKAAIRSDRGGGTMLLTGGTYTSTGRNGCPAIYSTADISVRGATCVSEASRAVIIEGKNSVTLEDCALAGNDQSTREGSVRANVLLYQSASGDAAEGTSTFTMSGGSMTCLSGAMFYCTNTKSVVDLRGADLTLSGDGTLLIVSAGRWGKEGRNGGDCTLRAAEQALEGTVYVDAISSLRLELTGSTYVGAIEAEGEAAVTLDGDSAWSLTADSRITSFTGDLAQVKANGFHLWVSGERVL